MAATFSIDTADVVLTAVPREVPGGTVELLPIADSQVIFKAIIKESGTATIAIELSKLKSTYSGAELGEVLTPHLLNGNAKINGTIRYSRTSSSDTKSQVFVVTALA